MRGRRCLRLVAALRWCGGDTRDRGSVCLDERLRGRPPMRASVCCPRQSRESFEALFACDRRGLLLRRRLSIRVLPEQRVTCGRFNLRYSRGLARVRWYVIL